MEQPVLDITTRAEFRAWLAANAATARACYVAVKRGRPQDDGALYYLDAVEEALCFGWIDSTVRVIGGRAVQRFSPRKKNSPWTELNKARVRRLETLGLMTDLGRAVLPPMGKRSFKIDPAIERALKDARLWSAFRATPPLYQRVRAYNIAFYKRRDPKQFARSLRHLLDETKQGRLYGNWNDYGRLPDD